jgi:hypothetical protein
MASEDVKKTTLITKTGLYDWTVMPFGLKNATSTFSRTMAEVFKNLGSRFLKVFVDDLNVHSESWGEHLRHLDKVLCRLREVNLKLNPNKCCFAKKAITFLGHMVSKEGIQPDPGKIQAVLHFPPPRNVTNVRSFLGLTGYYWKYVKGYSTVAGPLFALTRKDVAFVWDVNCEQAYQTLKTALVKAPILTRPDFKRTFWLDVDWSSKGVGAILSQKDGRFERVVAYASKSLTEAQRKFHPVEGECYALIWGVMHFRQYLHMKHFILRRDHKPLEWLATVSDAHGRRGRWVGLLQDFSFKIVHGPGLKHANVDALSRNPVGSAADDDDFGEGIQDTTVDVSGKERELLYIRKGEETEWIGTKRKDRKFIQHEACCFGINHRIGANHHHLYMLDVATEQEPPEGSAPVGGSTSTQDEHLQQKELSVAIKRKRPQYLDKQQQLELVLAAQELFEFGDPDLSPTGSDECKEHRTLAEIHRRYFWHTRTADVKAVVRECQQCQLAKSSGSIRSGDEHLKSILVCDLFYKVALDTAGPLPETKSGNKYILVAIDHYSKWCEAKAVADHGAKTAARFLEDEIICRYGVPRFVFTDMGVNGL